MLQAQRSTATQDQRAPVDDGFLSRLYRAQPSEIAGLVAPLPDATRAALAGFCYARAHLRTIGREVAAHCDENTLMQYAGPAMVRSLIEAKKHGRGDGIGTMPERARPKVTLASVADMQRKLLVVDGEE